MNKKVFEFKINSLLTMVLLVLILVFVVLSTVTNKTTEARVLTPLDLDYMESLEKELEGVSSTLENNKRVLSENRLLLEKVNLKELNCTAEFNVPRIQFFPRTQRDCRGSTMDYEIWGSSMQPFLYEGDEFSVEKVRAKDLELGDVVVFDRSDDKNADEGEIVHSVIAIYPEFILTAGYNNLWRDIRVENKDILYRYCNK